MTQNAVTPSEMLADVTTRRPVVAVCIATFRRPVLLERLLRALPDQIGDVQDRVLVRVIVVDNDPDGTGAAALAGLPAAAQPVYLMEPRPGIANARNACVRAAGEADFVIFIDDDEAPRPGWLRTLLDVQERTGAPVVTGPVVPVYDNPPVEWVAMGGFYDCKRVPTGTPISVAATNNTLVDRRVLGGASPFSDRFGLFWGGEDTLLFMRVEQDGHRQVWADEAEVEETVHPNRMTQAWLLQRAYKAGNTVAVSERALYGWGHRSVVRLAKALANIGSSPFRLLKPGPWRTRKMWAGMRAARGLGMLSGFFGVVYSEYKR